MMVSCEGKGRRTNIRIFHAMPVSSLKAALKARAFRSKSLSDATLLLFLVAGPLIWLRE